MNEQQKRINDLETRAAESALIADLAVDPQTRTSNSRLAEELRKLAREMRRIRLEP